MARRRSLRLTWVVTAICCCAVVSSCGNNARWLRQATYPPEFRYISDDEIESVMWRLAGRVHELEQRSDSAEPDVPALSALLDQVEAEARRLDARGGGSNHPYLQSKLQEFLKVVERAKLDLQRNPARIATVEDVWRACSGCHSRS